MKSRGIKYAECGCPAGLTTNCKLIGALGCVLEEFCSIQVLCDQIAYTSLDQTLKMKD